MRGMNMGQIYISGVTNIKTQEGGKMNLPRD